MITPLKWLDLVEQYLAYRRSLGFILSADEQRLRQFAKFANKMDQQEYLTEAMAAEWARDSKVQSSITWARRIESLRGFATHLRRFDERTQIPQRDLFGPSHRRLVPHIYTEQEVLILLDAAKQLMPRNGLRPATCHAIFGLLASSGLRISEALNLSRSDFDAKANLLQIRKAKLHKQRIVPIHPSVTEELQDYEEIRDCIIRKPSSEYFFLLDNGKQANQRGISHALRSICRNLGWKPRGDHPHHRLHDFRHTYILRSVLRMHEKKIDANQGVLALSTYVGHAKVADTYWYFTGIPELMSIAANRFWTYQQEDKQ